MTHTDVVDRLRHAKHRQTVHLEVALTAHATADSLPDSFRAAVKSALSAGIWATIKAGWVAVRSRRLRRRLIESANFDLAVAHYWAKVEENCLRSLQA